MRMTMIVARVQGIRGPVRWAVKGLEAVGISSVTKRAAIDSLLWLVRASWRLSPPYLPYHLTGTVSFSTVDWQHPRSPWLGGNIGETEPGQYLIVSNTSLTETGLDMTLFTGLKGVSGLVAEGRTRDRRRCSARRTQSSSHETQNVLGIAAS